MSGMLQVGIPLFLRIILQQIKKVVLSQKKGDNERG